MLKEIRKLKKKVVLSRVGEIRRVKTFLPLTRRHSRMGIKTYIFNFKKQTSKKQEYKKSKRNKRRKETKHLENRLKK